MTTIDELVRSELDRRYPHPVDDPDWDNVLRRATEVAARRDRSVGGTPSRRRRRRLMLGLAAVLAATAASLALVAPWSGTPGLMQQALAALGSGRYVHAVLQSTSVARRVDLASAKERPVPPVRIESVYDTKTGANDARAISGRVVFAGDYAPDPAISRFATGYRTALANGQARVVGTTIVDGEKATILRFMTRDNLGAVGYEDVTVSAATHNPLRVAYGDVDGRGNPAGPARLYRVLGISSSSTPPALPKPMVRDQRVYGMVNEIRRLDVHTARAALGHTAVWPGSAVRGATLRAIRLQRVETTIGGNTSSSPGLWLDYRGPREALAIQEAAKAQAGYGYFKNYSFSGYPIPAAGQALLACEGCHAGGGQAHPIWQAQLRTHGLYVTVRSSSRSLVVAAARALVPMP